MYNKNVKQPEINILSACFFAALLLLAGFAILAFTFSQQTALVSFVCVDVVSLMVFHKNKGVFVPDTATNIQLLTAL